MAFIVKATGGGDFTPHPAGVVPARCTKIVDIGTQTEDYKGQSKQTRKVLFFFETNELMTEGEMAGKPFLVNKEYTVSLGDKATLRKDLESWRGRKFTESELEGFDIKNVLGKPLLLNIVDYTKQNGAASTKIGGMMPLPSGMIANKAEGELVLFSLYDDEGNVKPLDTDTYQKLSQFWQKKISQSAEFITSTQGGGKQTQTSEEFEDDSIPF